MNKQELVALGLTEEAADKVLKEHVPYERFKQVVDERDSHKALVAERDKSIADLQSKIKAGEDAAESIANLQKQLEIRDAEVASIRKNAAIQIELAKVKAKNPKAVTALLDVEKFELQEDGSIKGMKEGIEALQKSDPYLFDTQPNTDTQQQPTSGFNPPAGGHVESGDKNKPINLFDAVKNSIETAMKG